jgi:LEA14-like dessication related protein
MKQTLPFLLIAAAAGAYYYTQSKKKFAGSVQFGLKSLKLSGVNVITKMGVLNPTNQTATIKSIVATLYLNNSPIATVKSFTPVTIQAAKETDIDIVFVPSGLGIFSSIVEFVKGGKIKGVRMVGNANVDGVTMPINIAV